METVAITAPIVNGICTPSVLQIYEKTEHTMRGKEKTENENLPRNVSDMVEFSHGRERA